jgi:hypothetical protein
VQAIHLTSNREEERIEEDEVRRNLPIRLGSDDLLPRELQHLAPAIARLEARGVLIRLSNGGGPRWALAKPWENA